jgi:hypothetical protein
MAAVRHPELQPGEGFIGPKQHFLVVTFQGMDRISLAAKLQYRVQYTFAPWTSVNEVAEQVQLIRRLQMYDILKQGAKGFFAAVNISDNKATRGHG